MHRQRGSPDVTIDIRGDGGDETGLLLRAQINKYDGGRMEVEQAGLSKSDKGGGREEKTATRTYAMHVERQEF